MALWGRVLYTLTKACPLLTFANKHDNLKGIEAVFFIVSKQIQSSHRFSASDDTSGGMVLNVCRTHMRSILCSVYSSKAFVEFRDEATNKALPKRKWSAEMQAAAASKIAAADKPPHIFKLTIIGWVCAALVVALFASLIYDSLKPSAPLPQEYTALLETPAEGDIYFGSYDTYKDKGGKLTFSGVGFTWFKIVGVDGDTYAIARSTDVSHTSRPKETLKNDTFAPEAVKMKITEQHGYDMRMQTEDGLMKIYFTGKK